jgi:hypothetical protein
VFHCLTVYTLDSCAVLSSGTHEAGVTGGNAEFWNTCSWSHWWQCWKINIKWIHVYVSRLARIACLVERLDRGLYCASEELWGKGFSCSSKSSSRLWGPGAHLKRGCRAAALQIEIKKNTDCVDTVISNFHFIYPSPKNRHCTKLLSGTVHWNCEECNLKFRKSHIKFKKQEIGSHDLNLVSGSWHMAVIVIV